MFTQDSHTGNAAIARDGVDACDPRARVKAHTAHPEVTLLDAFDALRDVSHKGFVFLDDALEESEWSFAEIVREAERRGRFFRSLGLEKGDRLAMILPESEDFVLSFLGAVFAGIVPVPMYPPLALAKLDAYIDSTRRVLEASKARMVLTTKRVSPVLWSLVSKVPTLEDLILVERVRTAADAKEPLPRVEIHTDDTCFLQFTSGSTAAPKGVVVTHRNLVANGRAIMFDGLASDPESDRGVSWLPLYHDMGLIGFVIAPLIGQVPVVFLPTLTFIRRPHVWMKTVDKYRGTITFAPNFALGLLAKRASRQGSLDLDLSCLRVVGCGAEPIHASTMKAFLEAYRSAGLRESALMPCYGMAEATLAVSFDSLERPFEFVTIDRNRYEEEHIAVRVDGSADRSTTGHALEVVSCGRPFPGHEVGIVDDRGLMLPEGRVGEIVVRGPSVTRGYFGNEAASREAIRDGWLSTGDLGFILDGNVFVSGRKKDLIILNGRNYHPQSVEWEVEQVEGIRKGNVVAFSRAGVNTEELVVVAESKSADADPLATLVRERVKERLGLVVAEVVLVPAGALPKTSSGKLQRRKTRSEFEAGRLERSMSRAMGSRANRITLARHITSSAWARLAHGLRGAFFANHRRNAAAGNPSLFRSRAESR